MADAAAATIDAKLEAPPAPRRRSRRMLFLLLGLLMLLGGGGAAAFFLVPGLAGTLTALLPGGGAPAASDAAPHPVFVEIPEMVVTLPNAGRPRQMRIRIALELARVEEGKKPADVLTPPVYDALVIYLRTLREPELDGAIAIDRLRGDIFRRLDLQLGGGVLRDVLITALVVG
jgi:flagellar FliL protein